MEEITPVFGKAPPATRARHSRYAHDGGHRPLRKQIRGQSVKICGEALVARGSETNQQYRRPQSGHAVGKHDGNDADRADEHGHFTSRVDRKPAPDHERGQPSSGYAADIRNDINHDNRNTQWRQVNAALASERTACPTTIEPTY